MAGHNKWSKIRRQKGIDDAKKGTLFTKLVKNIITCAKEGGEDPNTNPSLRLAIAKAKENSMPNDNIKRAIDKASAKLKGVPYDELIYEGYACEGVAVLIEVITDNKNRIVSKIREILNKSGGNLGEKGCVAWMFEKKGIITLKRGANDDFLIDLALEKGVLEIYEDEDCLTIQTELNAFNSLLIDFEKHSNIIESKVEYIASNKIDLDDSHIDKIYELVEKLEDIDDVQNVYTNIK